MLNQRQRTESTQPFCMATNFQSFIDVLTELRYIVTFQGVKPSMKRYAVFV